MKHIKYFFSNQQRELIDTYLREVSKKQEFLNPLEFFINLNNWIESQDLKKNSIIDSVSDTRKFLTVMEEFYRRNPINNRHLISVLRERILTSFGSSDRHIFALESEGDAEFKAKSSIGKELTMGEIYKKFDEFGILGLKGDMCTFSDKAKEAMELFLTESKLN